MDGFEDYVISKKAELKLYFFLGIVILGLAIVGLIFSFFSLILDSGQGWIRLGLSLIFLGLGALIFLSSFFGSKPMVFRFHRDELEYLVGRR